MANSEWKSYAKEVGKAAGQQAIVGVIGAGMAFGTAKFLEWNEQRREKKKEKKAKEKELSKKKVEDMSAEEIEREVDKIMSTKEAKRLVELTSRIEALKAASGEVES